MYEMVGGVVKIAQGVASAASSARGIIFIEGDRMDEFDYPISYKYTVVARGCNSVDVDVTIRYEGSEQIYREEVGHVSCHCSGDVPAFRGLWCSFLLDLLFCVGAPIGLYYMCIMNEEIMAENNRTIRKAIREAYPQIEQEIERRITESRALGVLANMGSPSNFFRAETPATQRAGVLPPIQPLMSDDNEITPLLARR